jgi:KDO2-lipid IV(A) lauroyltransferase
VNSASIHPAPLEGATRPSDSFDAPAPNSAPAPKPAPELRQPLPDPSAQPRRDHLRRASLRRAAATFWLNFCFWHLRHALGLARCTKWFYLWGAYRYSGAIRSATAANARRIFGPDVSRSRIESYGKAVVANFFEFAYDIGHALRAPKEQLTRRIESVVGRERYHAVRAAGTGAIIATAHMGSFEAGAASLLEIEPRVHVVFKRDAMGLFEQLRADLRHHLGVLEAPIDDGWTMWLRLREALQRDEVVMLQADRVMPGQKGCRVPFLHGHLLLPTGPIKLALASGAPIVPVFAVRTPNNGIRICIEDPIRVEASSASPHPALLRLAGVLERYVATYPEQWLLFQPAFVEDAIVHATKEPA